MEIYDRLTTPVHILFAYVEKEYRTFESLLDCLDILPLSSSNRIDLVTAASNSCTTFASHLKTARLSLTLASDSSTDMILAFLYHDLSNPLMVISGRLELLEQEKVLINEIPASLAAIKAARERIRTCFTFDKPQNFDLGALVKKLNRFHDRESLHRQGIKITYDCPQTTVYGIPSFVLRTLDNPIRNAIKARPSQNGTYTIAVRSYPFKGRGIVEIEDKGIGIDPKVIYAAACAAGYRKVPSTLYDTLELIFTNNVSGFKQIGKKGTGNGLNGAMIMKKGDDSSVTVSLQTTVCWDGKYITIDKEHLHGYHDPQRTSTGTTFYFSFPGRKVR